MIRKLAISLALIAGFAAVQPAQAHRVHCRVYTRPAVYVQPYYCPQPWGYYPVYQPVVQYVDCRDPRIAVAQDGINLFFNAISCSRR